ncbi:unnamed protein product [Adineta steineri]|uniref:Nuclear receptor domain-containing protein n=1 Tax=Adineta steineri TaxID=433720 RepID=A0A814WKE8_9BILA|nr:unnamed protein product [Adineta steineri]
MDETDSENLNNSTTASSTNLTTTQEQITGPRVCKVCGGAAHYSYYGAVVCHSCKVFFRRNAESRSVPSKCNFGDHCEININSRRACSHCRLAKCFESGMNIEMIRSSWNNETKKKQKEKRTTDSTSSAVSVKPNETNQPQVLPTLNLLQADQSTLTVDQWNHLSNLVHCFDEYSGFSLVQDFINEQNTLPPKFRFKYTSVSKFFTSMMANVQLVFEKNRDLLSLSLHDRTALLRDTVEYTTSVGGAYILRQAHLFDYPAFSESAELIFRPAAVAATKRLIDQLDPDIIFVKIICAVIAFLVSNYTVYSSETVSHNLPDAIKIIRVQDMYTELVWRYLLYKHNPQDAVLCFMNLIRCLLLVHDSIVKSHEARQFNELMDTVVESTEHKLNLQK